MSEHTQLVRPAKVAERLGISVVTLWRMRRRGDFPPPLRIGRAVAWRESELEAWIESRRGAN